jgi:hypothetical protein
LAFQSESEPNHAIFVTCATRLAAMRHTNWTARRGPVHSAESNQDHKLAGRVASDFGLLGRVSQLDIPQICCCAGSFSSGDEGRQRSDRRAAVSSSRVDEYRMTLSNNVFRSYETPGASEARPVGRLAERRRQHARDRTLARRRGAAATSSCARKANRHNAIRETRE